MKRYDTWEEFPECYHEEITVTDAPPQCAVYLASDVADLERRANKLEMAMEDIAAGRWNVGKGRTMDVRRFAKKVLSECKDAAEAYRRACEETTSVVG